MEKIKYYYVVLRVIDDKITTPVILCDTFKCEGEINPMEAGRSFTEIFTKKIGNCRVVVMSYDEISKDIYCAENDDVDVFTIPTELRKRFDEILTEYNVELMSSIIRVHDDTELLYNIISGVGDTPITYLTDSQIIEELKEIDYEPADDEKYLFDEEK